jgi:hypothetical protein
MSSRRQDESHPAVAEVAACEVPGVETTNEDLIRGGPPADEFLASNPHAELLAWEENLA